MTSMKTMEQSEELAARVDLALAREEIRAEGFSNKVRIGLLTLLAVIALLNINVVSPEASTMNAVVLVAGYLYGLGVYLRMRYKGYRPAMKYITSFLDILLLHVLLFMYTTIEHPSVALKHYVYVVVYPLILLTALRFDRRLTLLTGVWAVVLYVVLLLYLDGTGRVSIESAGYFREMFSMDVTIAGQLTKLLILIGFVALATYLAHYSRALIKRTIGKEVRERLEKQWLTREMELAEQVQHQLLPRTMPQVRGIDFYGTVKQGRQVGGDYFDVLQLSETSIRVVVADVSGKGIPAALIMSEVRAAVHLLSTPALPLDQFVSRLNTLLLESTGRHMFVTCIAIDIDESTNSLQYVNAGHPAPVVISDGGHATLARRTFALGSVSVLPELHISTVPCPPDSILVVFTDGICEHSNAAGEQYGELRILKFMSSIPPMSAEDIVRRLMEDARSFGDGSSFEDDATVAVVRRLS